MRTLTPLLLLTATAGCFSPAKTVDERTALEQQLVKKSIDRAVARLALETVDFQDKYRVEVNGPRGGHLAFHRHITTYNNWHRVP